MRPLFRFLITWVNWTIRLDWIYPNKFFSKLFSCNHVPYLKRECKFLCLKEKRNTELSFLHNVKRRFLHGYPFFHDENETWGWRALVCYCLTNDLNTNSCMKWEKTTGFTWQCTVPVVLAANLAGSMDRSGLKKLWGYHQGNSANLQHSEQANSGFRCAIYTQRPCVAKHSREEKAFI